MTKLIAVHGFMYDPGDEGSNNPQHFFDDMSELTGREVQGFSYYSVPFGFKKDRILYSLFQLGRAWVGSWLTGHLHPYRYAWTKAEDASLRLARLLDQQTEPVDIICHSLGSRVVIQALQYTSARRVNRVLILNGAELVRNAKGLSLDHRAKILNVCVKTDDVLRFLGSRFSGDKNGPTVGQFGVPGWNNLFLDDPEIQAYYKNSKGWTLKGDNPKSMFDHWYSYRFKGNQDLVRAWFSGEDLGF